MALNGCHQTFENLSSQEQLALCCAIPLHSDILPEQIPQGGMPINRLLNDLLPALFESIMMQLEHLDLTDYVTIVWVFIAAQDRKADFMALICSAFGVINRRESTCGPYLVRLLRKKFDEFLCLEREIRLPVLTTFFVNLVYMFIISTEDGVAIAFQMLAVLRDAPLHADLLCKAFVRFMYECGALLLLCNIGGLEGMFDLLQNHIDQQLIPPAYRHECHQLFEEKRNGFLGCSTFRHDMLCANAAIQMPHQSFVI